MNIISNPILVTSALILGAGVIGLVLSGAFTYPAGDKCGFSKAMKICLWICLIGFVATLISLMSTMTGPR